MKQWVAVMLDCEPGEVTQGAKTQGTKISYSGKLFVTQGTKVSYSGKLCVT